MVALITHKNFYVKQSIVVKVNSPRKIENLVENVCIISGIPHHVLISKKKPREITDIRQIAMHIAVQNKLGSLKLIGKHFGGRDHSTVIHANEKVIELLEIKDKSFKKTFEKFAHLINN